MSHEFDRNINPSKENELMPLEKARQKVVNYLQEDAIIDPTASVRFRVLSDEINFNNEMGLARLNTNSLADSSPILDKYGQLLKNADLSYIVEHTRFNIASFDFSKELSRTSSSHAEGYLDFARELREIKEQDLERRRRLPQSPMGK
jgi:hypothetical protein